jgi:hypothetical protein
LAEDLQLARAISEMALATDGVYALATGRFVEVATYGAGDKVTGVFVDPDEVRVHIVARYPLSEPIPALAERIREQIAPRAGGRAATVVVEDIEVIQDENL